MTTQNLFLIMMFIIVFLAWYANSSKRNKIYCSFTRVNKTSVHKFVKMQSRYVVFDSKRFDIVPSCVVFDWWTAGIVHMLFPQWVATLNYSYESRWPIDPTTGKHAIISPEVRNSMNKEEWVKSYAKGFQPPSMKKQGFMMQWLPIIAIILVVGVAIYMNMTIQSDRKVNTAAFQDILNRLNAISR